jgi:RNA polymerase sigma-70 factor (ECF subfamily)
MPVRTSNGRVGPLGSDVGPEILEACRRDDREALRALYEAYKDRVYSIAYHFLRGDHAGAADVTQQVFLKLMSGLGSYHGGAAFSTWLYRTVINACIDSRRRVSRLTAVAPETLQAIVDPRAARDDVIAAQERARSVQDAIAALPGKLRAAVLLRYVSDLGYPEIAAALHCSIGTVSSRLHRAHRLLAERLAPLRMSSSRGDSR